MPSPATASSIRCASCSRSTTKRACATVSGRTLNSTVRQVVGRHALPDLLSPKRDDIMGNIKDRVNTAGKAFGIEVIDVRIVRTDLPEQIADNVYARMRSERERIASQLRAEGEEIKQTIIANADRQRIVILAEATRQGQIPARHWRRRTQPHPRRGIRTGPRVLQVLSPHGRLPRSVAGRGHHLGAVAG